jgi:hypothetical protein
MPIWTNCASSNSKTSSHSRTPLDEALAGKPEWKSRLTVGTRGVGLNPHSYSTKSLFSIPFVDFVSLCKPSFLSALFPLSSKIPHRNWLTLFIRFCHRTLFGFTVSSIVPKSIGAPSSLPASGIEISPCKELVCGRKFRGSIGPNLS